MNAKERVIAAIEGRDVDYVPACFSLHFPKGCENGKSAVDAHLQFFKETDTDICKIMNENLVPDCAGVKEGSDWRKIPSFDRNSDFMRRQIELTERILDKCNPNKFVIGTLHGVVASSLHPIERTYGYDGGRLAMVEHLRQNKQVVLDAYKRIAEGLCCLAEKYVEIGLDAVYYAGLGGEYRYYSDEEFREYIEPLDIQVLKMIRNKNGYCILHICKDHLNMARYHNYSQYADIVNWGVYEAPLSLEEGRKLFPGKTIMGGLANRSGVLVEGSADEIRKAVWNIIDKFGVQRFILGADCTLPTEIDYGRIREAVEAARTYCSEGMEARKE